MLIYVYNPNTLQVERYTRDPDEIMPHVVGRSLTVREFRGSTKSTLLWTDLRTMQTWNAFRAYYARPIHVGYAFKRIWEGGHAAQSQHYAGMAFDTGQNLTSAVRNQLHASAIRFCQWTYVEPQYLTPTWVHFDRRLTPPACASGGYITLRHGSRGVYVLTMQDALNALGYTGSGLDGIFGNGTQAALERFQRANGLVGDGICGCGTWTALATKAVGIGKTPTVVNP